MKCDRCGFDVAHGESLCAHCGTPMLPSNNKDETKTPDQLENPPIGKRSGNQTDLVVRVLSGIVLIAGLYWCFYAEYSGLQMALLAPIFAGLLSILLEISVLTGYIESLEVAILNRKSHAQTADGKVARFVRRPFYASIAQIWKLSRPISNPNLRAAARITSSLYIIAVFVSAILIASYIAIAVIVFVAFIALILWILSFNDKTRRSGTSKREVDWFGQEHVVHRDAEGRKTGESWQRTGINGPYSEHTDAAGHTIGLSRNEPDAFGSPRTVHFDESGRKTGVSQEENEFLGDSKTVHYDDQGKKTGESHSREDPLDGGVTDHFDRE